MINAIFKERREEFAYLLPCVLETLWKRDTEKTENYLPPDCVRTYFERLPKRLSLVHKTEMFVLRQKFRNRAQTVFETFEAQQGYTKEFAKDITKIIVAQKLQEEAMQLNDSIYVELFKMLYSGMPNRGTIISCIVKLNNFVTENAGAFGFVDKIEGPAPDVHLLLQSALGADLTTIRESEGGSFEEMVKTAIKECRRLEPEPESKIGNIIAAFRKFEGPSGPSAGSAPEESPVTGAKLAAEGDLSRRKRFGLDLPSDVDAPLSEIKLAKQLTPFKDKVSRAVWRTLMIISEEALHFSNAFEIGVGLKVEKPATGLTPFCALYTILNSNLRPKTFNVNDYETDLAKCARHGANVFEITREDTTEVNTEQAKKFKSLIESFSDFLDDMTEEIGGTEALTFACSVANMLSIVCFETESDAKVVDQTEAVNLIHDELARERRVLLQLVAKSRVRLEDDQKEVEEELSTVPPAQYHRMISAGVATNETKVEADPGTYTPTFALRWIQSEGTEMPDQSVNKFKRARTQESVDLATFKFELFKNELVNAINFCAANKFDRKPQPGKLAKAQKMAKILEKTQLYSKTNAVKVESEAVDRIGDEIRSLFVDFRMGFNSETISRFNVAIHAQMQERKQPAHESRKDSAEDSAEDPPGVPTGGTQPKPRRGSLTKSFISGLSTVGSGIVGAAGAAATAVLDTFADATALKYVSEVKLQVFPDTTKLTPECALCLILTNSTRPQSFNTDSFAEDLQICKDEDYKSNTFTVVSAAEPKDLEIQAKLQARLQALIAKLERVEPQNYDGATQNERFVVITLSILKRTQIIPERDEFNGRSVKLNPSTIQLLEKEVDRQIRVVGKLVVPESTTKGGPGVEKTARDRYSLRSSADFASAEVTNSDVNPNEGMITPGYALREIAAVPLLESLVGSGLFAELTSSYGSALNVFKTNAGKTADREHDENVNELEYIEAGSAFFLLVFRKINKKVLDHKLKTKTTQALGVLKQIIGILKKVQCTPEIEEWAAIKPQTKEIKSIVNVCEFVMDAILDSFGNSIRRAYRDTEIPEGLIPDAQVKVVFAAVLEALKRVQQTASSEPEEAPAGTKGAAPTGSKGGAAGGGAGGPGVRPKAPVEVPTGEKGAAPTGSEGGVAGVGAGGPGALPKAPEPSSAALQKVMKIGTDKQLKSESCALGNWLITTQVAQKFQLEKFVDKLQKWCSTPGFVAPRGGNSPNDSVSFLVQLLCEPRTLDRLIEKGEGYKFTIASSGGNSLSDREACFFGLSEFSSADSNFAKDVHTKFTRWVESHTIDKNKDACSWPVPRPAFALLTLIGIFMTAFSSGEKNNVLVIGESEVALFAGSKIEYPGLFIELLLAVMNPWFPVPIPE
jgi:hypothetical protein